MGAEVVLEHEEFLLELGLRLHSLLVLDGLLPHSHELPLLEFLEEIQFFDVVVRVSLDEPLAKGQELNGSIVLIQGQPLTTECIVL